MAKAPDYGSYIPDANDPVFVTQAKAAQLAKEQPLYASGQGTPIFNNPGGIDGYVQFNSASSFGGDVGFTYNNKTRSVNILGNLNVGGFLNSKFYTNFSNLRISGGSEGDVIFTDGEGNLSWGNLDNYTTNAELTARFTAFQQGNVNFTGANVSLGNVSNLHISGGSPNFILSTDGNGNLSWIEETGGGPNRFSIYNGTSNVAVPDTDGNVFVNVNDEYQWVYNTDGELLAGGQFVALQGELTAGAGYTFDETSRDTGMYSDSDGQLKFKANDKLVAFYTDNDVHLYTKSADYLTTYDWHLDRTGNLTLPTGGAINYSNGVSILSGLGGGGDSFDQSLNTDDDVTFGTVSSTTVNVSQINGTNPGDELIVQANGLNWTFGTEGNLTLPSNTARINYANGTNILDGLGGDGTGLSASDFGEGFSLTASNKIVTNKLYSTNETQPTQHYRLELDTNGVVVLPDGSIINGSTIRGVAGTSELNYTGITIGPNSGDAEKTWIWVDHANAYISTNNFVNTWTFDNNGNFILPVDGDILDSTGNSVLGGSNLGNLSVEDNVIVSSDSEAYINFDADGGNNILALGTGDGATVQISTDDGATNFEFTASEGAGSIKFPDDTVQTTAYIGQEISPSVPRSDTAPVAANGQLWFNTLEGRMYIKYDGAWVDAAPLMTPAPELNPEFTSITFPDASVQTTAFPTKLVNGNREVVLNSNGSLLVAEDIILPQTGRIIKDCNNNGGTTSQRWVNIPTDTEVELIRAYTGDPDALGGLDVERAKISVEWQTPDKTGLSITAFDDGDEYKWEFNGDGTTQFPAGIIKAPPGDNTISMQSQNSKNFVTVSDGQVLISAEDTTEYNWAFGTTGVLTLPSSSYLESSDNNLKVGAQGSVTIRSNAAGGAGLKAWTFGTDGNLTLPGNIRFPNGANIAVPSGTPRTNAIAITNATELLIGTNTATTSSLWTFGIDGSTIFPDNTVKGYCFTTTNTVTNYIPQSAQFLYTDSPILRLISTIGGTWYIKGPGLVGWKQITSVQDNGGVALIVRIGSGPGPLGDGSEFPAGGGNVYTISQYLEFDLTVADKTWMFDKDGKLTFPSGAGFVQGDSGQLKTNDGTTLSLDLRDTGGRGFYTNGDGFSLRSNGSNTWVFGTGGNITLPTNTSAINYANGQSILDGLGGGSSYGNSNVANYLPTHTGNVSANYFLGNVAGGNVSITGQMNVSGTITSNFIPQSNITYSLGNSTNRWKDIYLASSTVYLGNVQLSEGAGNSLSVLGNVTTTGTVYTSDLVATSISTTGGLSVAGGNILTSGAVYANFAVSTQGNVTGNYFIGNGSQLTDITVSTATTAATVTTNAQPNITSVGTLSGLTVGPNSSIVLSGTSGYVKANSLQGTDGTQTIYLKYGSVAGAAGIATDLTVGTGGTGNLTANGTISATGNVTGSYFLGNGSQLTSITATTAATVTTNAQPNITSVGTLSSLSISGNITSGNILTGGLLSATGNITGGNIRTAGVMSSTGNLTSGNILTGGLLSATGNITGGNLITSGLLTVAGNISAGGNIIGASSNVSLVAGSYTWTFDNTSNAAFPGNLSATSNIRSNASFIATNVSGTISIGNTNSYMMGIGNANNYVQSYVHNKSNTSEASADMIVYGSAGTDNSGYMDMGMTSNNFSSSFFTVTGKSEGYLFMSGIAGTSGNMVLATGPDGTNNSIEFYVGGFSSAKGSNRPLLVTNTGISVTGNITGNTNGFAIGYRDVPQVAASNATIALTDAGKHFYSTTAGNFTLTIPNNATTTFSTGTAISIVVQAAGNILVNAASGVTLYMAGNSTAANRVVGTYGMATIMKVASDTWFINGTGVS